MLGVARIAVGNGQILTAAALDEKEVILFANAPGTSSLFVWNADGRYQRVKINVVPGDTSRFAREIAAFLTSMPNAKASIIGDKVIVEGDNLSDVELTKIGILSKQYPQIVNFTNEIGWEQMILMDVKVVEFPTSELRDIGFKWNAAGGASIGGIWSPGRRGHQGGLSLDVDGGPVQLGEDATYPKGLNVLSAVNMGLNAQLNLYAAEGKAAILAQPQLAARNGAKASFLAGGEYPYVTSNANGSTIVFKPYGIRLEITPQVDRNGVIRATIMSEVSSIDASIATPNGPALSTRRTETEFNVQNGDTIVLSGLLSRKTNTSIDKVPLLGDIPILGALFRSKRYQNDETELVIFVTPSLVSSQTPGLLNRVERSTERAQQLFKQSPFLPALQADPIAAPTPATAIAGLAVMPNIAPTTRQTVAPAAQTPAHSYTLVNAADNPLQPSPAPTAWQVTQEGLVVRAQPHAQSAMLMQLAQGATVQSVQGEPVSTHRDNAQKWHLIAVGKIQGWVPSSGLHMPQPATPISALAHSALARQDQQGALLGTQASLQQRPLLVRTHPKPGTYRVALAGLAMRVTADINAPVLQSLPKDSLVEVLAEPPQSYFAAVQVGTQRGWVAAQWLRSIAAPINTLNTPHPSEAKP